MPPHPRDSITRATASNLLPVVLRDIREPSSTVRRLQDNGSSRPRGTAVHPRRDIPPTDKVSRLLGTSIPARDAIRYKAQACLDDFTEFRF